MKWAYSIRNKYLASVMLFALCMLVLFSNWNDRRHSENVKNSIQTMYEDRLLAEYYILKMTENVYRLREQMISGNVTGDTARARTAAMIAAIHELGNQFLKTKFTNKEDIRFFELTEVLNDYESHPANSPKEKLAIADKAVRLLDSLSAIQLDESKHIIQYSEKLYMEGKISSQFAFAVIIIILLVLQGLVFSSKPLTVPERKSHLN